MKSKNPSIFNHLTTSGSKPPITQRPLSFSNFHRDPQVILYQLVFLLHYFKNGSLPITKCKFSEKLAVLHVALKTLKLLHHKRFVFYST